MKDIAEFRRQRREYLSKLPQEMNFASVDEALKPESLTWCLEKLASGADFEELRAVLGLGPAAVDPVWRALRKELTKFMVAKDSEEAFENHAADIHDLTAELKALIKKVDAEIEKGNEPIVLKDSKGEVMVTKFGPVVIERKNYHHLVKIKADAIKLLMEQANTKVNFRQESEKLKRDSIGSGVHIHIHSKIPRPEREAQKVAQDIKEKFIEITGKKD